MYGLPDKYSINIQSSFQKLKIAGEFGRHFKIPQNKTQLHLIQKLLLERFQLAHNEWKDFIAHLDTLHSTETEQEQSTINAEDNLAAWLAGLRVEGETEPVPCGQSRIKFSTVHLYRCSHCHNPSAVLRKCSGCGQTR